MILIFQNAAQFDCLIISLDFPVNMADSAHLTQGRFDPHEFANAGTIASWLEAQPAEKKLEYVSLGFRGRSFG